MAIIHYDQEILNIAERIFNSPSSTRGDVLRLIQANEHHPWCRKKADKAMMPPSNYLGREAISQIYSMAQHLPSRIRKTKMY